MFISFTFFLPYSCNKRHFGNRKGGTDFFFYIKFESVVVDVENGRRKSITRSLQEYGRWIVKDICIAD